MLSHHYTFTLCHAPPPTLCSPRWVFLFDKVMLICHKKNKLRLGFEVRYSVKHVFPVNSLRVEPITNPSGKGGNFSQGFKLIVKGHGDFLAFAKTEELKSQWIDAINHARWVSCAISLLVVYSFREVCKIGCRCAIFCKPLFILDFVPRSL